MNQVVGNIIKLLPVRDQQVLQDAVNILRSYFGSGREMKEPDSFLDNIDPESVDWNAIESAYGPHPLREAIRPVINELQDLTLCVDDCKCSRRSTINTFLKAYPEYRRKTL